MHVEFNFIFDRKKSINQANEKGVIELRCYYQGKTRLISTKIFILKSEWNNETERVNKRHSDHIFLNDKLDTLLEKYKKARRDAEHKNQEFNLESVKNLHKTQQLKTTSFIDFALNDIKNNNFLKPQTKRKHYDTINKLKQFNKDKDVLFLDLNFVFVSEYINYLKGLNLAHNTVRNHNKNLKSIINIAIKKNYYDHVNPCCTIKLKEQPTTTNILYWAQIIKIESLQFEAYEPKLQQIRDMFLFACFTGLRISDVINLKTEFIKQTPNGFELDFFTIKVNKHAILPLYNLFKIKDADTTHPLQILNKYYNKANMYLFTKYTEQHINQKLKEIGSMAQLPFALTFKIARHTFCTYMANKIDAPTLQRLAQHSDIKTTLKYVHLNQKLINERLIKADWD